jgi:hypothetical protein
VKCQGQRSPKTLCSSFSVNLYRIVSLLTFIVRHLNSVFMLRVRNFFRNGPLNHGACLTINVYKLRTKGDEIRK